MLPVFLSVEDSSRAPEARNAARTMARALDFDEAGTERAAIVVTEICTNLLKHAGGGSLVLTANEDLNIEVLAMDRGPGMASVRDCLADGFSTTGTSGTGLGAIARMSAFADAYSIPGRGTVIFALINNVGAAKLAPPRACGLQAPKPGQDVCGDSWAWKLSRGHMTVLVADGLGHGPDAAAASRCAVDIFHNHRDASPKELLESIHFGLRHTRGAAASVASVDVEREVVEFAGLGNVAGFVCESGRPHRQMVTMNGVAGLEGRALLREFSYPLPKGAAVVMHSDGLSSHWSLDDSPGLLSRGPAMIAGILFRDFRRLTDDATVVVAA